MCTRERALLKDTIVGFFNSNIDQAPSFCLPRLLNQEQESVCAVPTLREDVWQPCLVSRQHAGFSSHTLCSSGLPGCARRHPLRAGPAPVPHHQTRGTPAPSFPNWQALWIGFFFVIFILFLFLLVPPKHLYPYWYFRQPLHTHSLSANPLQLPAPLNALTALSFPSSSPTFPSCPLPVAAPLLGNQIVWLNLQKQFFFSLFYCAVYCFYFSKNRY